MDLVDPDVAEQKKEAEDPDEPPKSSLQRVDPDLPVFKKEPVAASAADAGATAASPKTSPAKKAEPKKPAEPPVEPRVALPSLITKANDADLDAAWEKWKLANASADPKVGEAARTALLALRKELGASNLEPFAHGMLRAALAHEASGDSAGAIELGLAAVELAPDIPSSWLGLARIYFAVDPSGVPRIADALKRAAEKTVLDPRYFRPLVADLATALLTAVCALAVAVVVVLFARRARYALFDFHFLFPKVLARWQSATLAVLLLSLPIVFRAGLAPTLLVALAAVAFYLTSAERRVAAILVALLGAVPTLGALVVNQTAFASTPAETVYLLEQGGAGAEQLAQKVAKLAAEEKASFAELFALGRFELRRGKLDLAIPRLKAALLKKPNDPRAELNLGVAMLLGGDLENPKSLFENTAKAEPTLAEPLYDLARLYQRRGAALGKAVLAAEIDRASSAMAEARVRNPAVPEVKEPAPGEKLVGNTYLMTLALSRDELLSLAALPEAEERVRAQLTRTLLGALPEPIAPFFPAACAVLLLGLGRLGTALAVARGCTQCGAPVSHRADHELGRGSTMCAQCVNVFARKGVVPPALKVRKQLEVSRYTTRMERLSYAFGLVCSGMGHVFSGRVVRGTIHGFLFMLVVVLFLQRNGVLRAPYDPLPQLLRLLPLGLAFLLVYLLSLRGLIRGRG